MTAQLTLLCSASAPVTRRASASRFHAVVKQYKDRSNNNLSPYDKVSRMNTNLRIFKPETLPSNSGPPEYFTGSVKVTPIVQGEEPSCLACASVAFQSGARSAWHTHPKGQLLIVTEGSGLIQQWGEPVRRIQKGDVIWTPPGVKHWHGAGPSSAMTHTAIQESLNGKVVDWMEKVTDEEYCRPPESA
jgi:quercetin dioxygenase-like cupin family protein